MTEIDQYFSSIYRSSQESNIIVILNTVRTELNTRFIDHLVDYLSNNSASFELKKRTVLGIVTNYLIK